jgi:hypothetical protein
MSAQRRRLDLAAIEGRLAEAQRDLLIVRERLAAQSETVDATGLRMVLSETPQASIAYRRASAGLERLQTDLTGMIADVAALARERDKLSHQFNNPVTTRP